MHASEIPPFVRYILERLKNTGYKGYIVGGAVRDSCRDRPLKDWDVAASASPELIRTIFQGHAQFSLKHDTVSLVSDGRPFEITTFRGEGGDIEEDLRRRDFTINAMAFDAENGAIIDPCRGREDLAKHLLRACGDPRARFIEDPLRLLRAVRFAAETGFHIEKGTLEAMKDLASLLRSTAQERIRDELVRILVADGPSASFNLMIRTDLLKEFLPELLEGRLKRQNAYHRHTILKHILVTVDNIRPDPDLRLAALLHDIAKPRVGRKIDGEWHFYGHEKESALLAGEILGRLRFKGSVISKVVRLIRHHLILYDASWSDGAVRRLIRKVGDPLIWDLFALREADLSTHTACERQMEMLTELRHRVGVQLNSKTVVEKRDLAMDGFTVMAETGLAPGPVVGKVLKELHEKILDHPEWNNKGALIALLKQIRLPDI